VLFDAIGAALWVGVAVGLGYLFHDAIGDVMAKLSSLGKYGVMLVVAAFAVWIVVKWCRRYFFVKQLRMDRVSVDELKQMLAEKKVQALVDVRSALTQAATGRIPGALAIDMKKIEDSFKGVPIDGEVILYCACPNEATAVKIAQKLKKVGYKRIRPLLGGIDAWIEAGHAVER
jgi:rhodanese-related sulfurtransferase